MTPPPISIASHDRATQMVIFYTLVNAKNFTEAAKKLGVSVSHVSKQLGQLESTLNVKLVQRTTRSFQLTEAGKQYLSACRRVMDAVTEGERQMRAASEDIAGVVKIGLAQSLGTLHIIPAIEKMRQAYPDLNIELQLFDHKADMIADGLDLWITNYQHIPEGYVAQRLTDCRFVLCASPDYLTRHPVPSHPNDLAKHNCLIYQNKDEEHNVWSFQHADEGLQVNVKGNYHVDLAEALRNAAIAGSGIAYLATYLLSDEFQTGKLVQLMPEWQPNQQMPFYIIYPSRRHLPRKLTKIISEIKQHIGNPPYWDARLKGWVKLTPK